MEQYSKNSLEEAVKKFKEKCPPITIDEFTNQRYGWICPRCAKVISPYITFCSCQINRENVVGTSHAK